MQRLGINISQNMQLNGAQLSYVWYSSDEAKNETYLSHFQKAHPCLIPCYAWVWRGGGEGIQYLQWTSTLQRDLIYMEHNITCLTSQVHKGHAKFLHQSLHYCSIYIDHCYIYMKTHLRNENALMRLLCVTSLPANILKLERQTDIHWIVHTTCPCCMCTWDWSLRAAQIPSYH